MCEVFDAEYYEKTREEFEKRIGKKSDLEKHGQGYVNQKTNSAFVGWCLGVQYQGEIELRKKQNEKG